MADSQFLKYQDKNNDGLIDACDDLVDIPDVNNCPACVPKPSAVVPDWRYRTIDEPFLNEKICMFQITAVTQYTTTILETLLEDVDLTAEEAAEGIKDRYDEYVDEAIDSLLLFFGKDQSDESKQLIKNDIEYTEYYLDPRPFSRLKLLYSIPYDTLANLPDAELDDEDTDADTGDVEVSYTADEMELMTIRVRKGLNLYSRYQKMYIALEGGNLYVDGSGTPPQVFSLERYGDIGIANSSVLSKILPELDDFLVSQGFNLKGIGGLRGAFNDAVVKLDFTFTNEFKLKKLVVYTQQCGEIPTVFTKKLKFLNNKGSWKDRTAVAYFARMRKMERDLTARTPKPWLEFVKEYTYPLIYSEINAMYSNTDPANTVTSCVADALAEEGKQLGQDILDEVFSLGDAIAYKFHVNLCRNSLGEVIEDDIEVGKYYDPETKEYSKNMLAMAQEQAFKTLDANNQVFVTLCSKFLGSQISTNTLNKVGAKSTDVNELWRSSFDRIKECGLTDLLIDGINCLFGGLSLEEALAKMCESALRAMSIENFGDLFIGLPPDKQAELDALVKRKIAEGDIFEATDYGGAAGSRQELSDILSGKLEGTRELTPSWEQGLHIWEDKEIIEEERSNKTDGPYEGMTAQEMQQTSQLERRTLAQQFDPGSIATSAKQTLSPNVIKEAYFLALIEVYSDNLLGLVDELNKFPGAQIISTIIALFDCPRPPILNPSVMDFLKDVELPFCRNINDIRLPRLQNPFGWIPELKDWTKFIWQALLAAIQEAVLTLLIKLLVKLCELIGNAICQALETVGDIAASLPDIVTGREKLLDVVRESICGEDAPAEQIESTLIDMIASMGVGGTALADTAQTLRFAEDLSSASTRRELNEAFLGNPSNDFLEIVDGLVEYEYPDYRDALSNKEAIASFFKNMGNLMPLDFRSQMRDFVDALPLQDVLPANPSLCATPEQLDNFNALRCELLSGRATPEQCETMLDNYRGQFLEDLDQLSNALQGGIPNYLSENLPPLVSDPGCDNGLVPFESEEAINVATTALSNELEQLQVDFSYDMLGNGPGKTRWGFINMVMSDTMGFPYTAHQRRVFGDPGAQQYVDFYVTETEDTDDTKYANTARQRGAYPNKVAGWLEDYMLNTLSISYGSTNDVQEEFIYSKSFDSLGIKRFSGSPQDLLRLPDLGYNIQRSVDMTADKVLFIEEARKLTPDMSLFFNDNAGGEGDDGTYNFGFQIDLFVSDIIQSGSTYVNQQNDNVRVKITNFYNASAQTNPNSDYMTDAEAEENNKKTSENNILDDLEFEFMSIDDTLSTLLLEYNIPENKAGMTYKPSSYTEFYNSFTTEQPYSPPVLFLKGMLNENGDSYTSEKLKEVHDAGMTAVTNTIMSSVAENSASFKYGAVFDDLTLDDIEYVTDEGTPYYEAEIEGDDGQMRSIRNKDQILGISKMQYEIDNGLRDGENRVFYLDPTQFGGSYMNPPIYIKPLDSEGWLGFIDVVFPEISPCKPYRTDLVDFSDIQSKVSEVYPSIPEDERLASDPDCIVELPYNRILERPSAAGLEGIISAAIRIYASLHMIKAMATFTKFYPKFPDTFSNIYASYISEVMEKSFKDAQKPGWEFFNPFKDEEFWYAFLEQSVQLYNRKIERGDIQEPPQPVLDALIALNDAQENYQYAYREELREEKRDGTVSLFKTLKNYRSEKNLEAVQETEELAKIVFKELVVEELNFMGEKFVQNLKLLKMSPDVFNLGYYALTDLSSGSSLDLNKEIKEETADLPTEGDELYTAGGELYVKESVNFEEGTDYVGYYHVHQNEDGTTQYMAGEFHTTDPHDVLDPFASKVIVPIGDVDSYGSAVVDTSKPFAIEKYIAINGTKMDPSTAVDQILSNDGSLNLAEVYPGTLEKVTDDQGRVVGLKGEMGVRYGLEFSLVIDGGKTMITSVEVDALDLPISQFAPFEGDSKMLLCLVNLLTNDLRFKLLTQYVFPLNKMTAVTAMYNDLSFLWSIGQIVVEPGDWKSDDAASKPGSYITIEEGEPVINQGVDGWVNPADRKNPIFILTWDEWDKVVLRNSKARIKKIFKNYYNSRDFTAGDMGENARPGSLITQELRERFKIAPGSRLLPRWKKRSLRSNPFNSKDELCENTD